MSRYAFSSAVSCLFGSSSFFFLIILQLSHPAFAQNQSDPGLAEILQGFEQPTTPDQLFDQNIAHSVMSKNDDNHFPAVNFTGSVSQLLAYAPYNHTNVAGYSIHGLTNTQSKIALTVDIKPSTNWYAQITGWAFYDFTYRIQGRDNYSSEMVEENESEIELGETFVQGQLSTLLDISFGRQIEVWGKSDFFRIIDVINPSDNRELLLNDIEFTRLPLWMTTFDFYFDTWHISTLLTHEFRYSKDPVYGGDFYPFDFHPPPREDISNTLQNSTLGLSAGRNYSGYDIDFYFLTYLKEIDAVGLTREISERHVTRLTMLGAATEKAVGSWLYKLELAVKNGLEFYTVQDQNISSLDLLLGSDYTGFADTRISFEIHNRHLFYTEQEQVQTGDTPVRDELVWAFRLAKSFNRDTYELVFLSFAGGFDFSHGSVQNLSLKYKVNDNFTINSGYIFVNKGNNYFMENVGKNDKIFLTLHYEF